MDQRSLFPNARVLLGLADEIVIKIQRHSHRPLSFSRL
jgi:hypothetical protein